MLAVVLFTVALVTHGYLILRHRTWYFTTFVVGIFMEVMGYTFRILSSQQDTYSVPWYVAQYFCIVVAPVFFSAAIYAIVSVLIKRYGEEYAPVSPRLVLWVFIACDVGATILQVTGASLVGVAYSSQKDPSPFNNILLAGLAYQASSFAVFLCVLFWTLYKARLSPVKVDKMFLAALIVATLAVYLRTCFRLSETAQGLMTNLSTHEVYFGCLEFAPIAAAVYLFTYWHPGRWLQAFGSSSKEATVRQERV